ncbi:MAG TPA: MBL fold metallo-hydrolase [Actinoplanes sp.]|jgi:glyoxylase-like metal-dependent hydrolase (beta-lactamase superfamily II)
MEITRQVGPFTVTALLDAAGPAFMTRAAAFPDATPAQWAAAEALDPSEVEWWLSFRGYAIRSGDGPVTLVDAGIGPEGSLAASYAPVPGRLPAELAAAGIEASDVTAIVLTHLHGDHVGWAVPADSPFTEARVIAPKADVDLYTANRAQAGQYDRLIEPLRAAGRLQEVEGGLVLAPGLRVVPTPGHTPGHQSVWAYQGSESLLITGDLLVHAVQLVDPDLAYASDMDAAVAGETRRAILDDVRARGSVLAVSHLGTAFR